MTTLKRLAIAWTILSVVALFALATFDVWTSEAGLTTNLWLTWFFWGALGSTLIWAGVRMRDE